MHTTHTRMHKSIQASHLLHLPFMCGSSLLGTPSQVGTVRKRGKEWKMGEDSTSVLQFYDFLNVLERLEVEPNCSPSCVFESEVLTGASLANKAARHSHSRGMWVLSDAVKEEEGGKRFSFSLKLRKSLLPRRRAVLLGSYLGVSKESSLPNAWPKTKR